MIRNACMRMGYCTVSVLSSKDQCLDGLQC